jgi:hypothetical protein
MTPTTRKDLEETRDLLEEMASTESGPVGFLAKEVASVITALLADKALKKLAPEEDRR